MTKAPALLAPSLLAMTALALAACGEPATTEPDTLPATTPTTTTDTTVRNDAMLDDDDGDVVVTVNGISEAGTVYVALQAPGIFGAADASYGATADSDGGSVEVTVENVTPGAYAIAVFQDTNGNGTLDMDGNGMPAEPWGFSNGAGTRGAPSFADARIEFDGSGDRATVTLNGM